MNTRDWKEIIIWAGVTALVVAGIMGAGIAVGEEPAPPPALVPSAVVDGCTITATMEPTNMPHELLITFTAVNPTPQKRSLRLEVSLSQRVFTGNPFSRTMNPSDTTTTTESVTPVSLKVPGSAKITRTLTLPIKARHEKDKVAPTYVVSVAVDDKPVELATISAHKMWPKE